MPGFVIFRKGRKPRLPATLSYPVIVKCLTKEGSLGISQSSIVDNDENDVRALLRRRDGGADQKTEAGRERAHDRSRRRWC